MSRHIRCRTAVAGNSIGKLRMSCLLLLSAFFGNPAWTQSALEPFEVEGNSSWLSGLYINQNSSRTLCAMETSLADDSVFRINYYGLGNMFLEITTSDHIAESPSESELTFVSDKRPALSLPTFVEDNFMVVEMTNDAVAGELLQIVARSQELTVMSPNAPPFRVPVTGSAKALDSFISCVLSRH